MNTILVGNGVTIQFGGKYYTNARIIKRAQNNIYTHNFPAKVYPKNTIDYFNSLVKIIPDVLNGD